jgi:hypothetical protein
MRRDKSDPAVSEKANLAHEIQQFFMYNYSNRWVPEKELKYHSRAHNQVFNELVRQRFIERKRSQSGYTYKWKAPFPQESAEKTKKIF